MTPTDLAGLCERLRASTALMATTASVRMDVWQDHSTAALEAAAAIESLVAALRQIDGMCPATCETSLAHDMAQIARTALEGASDDR